MKTEKISVQKICMIAFAICINFVGGQIALFLKLPIYLDSIGTVDVYGFFQMFLSRILDQEPEKLDILQDLIRGDLK